MDNLRTWLEQRPVVHYDRLWDCQDWLLEAVWALKKERGWVAIDEGFTERGLREALREERELWERADDHYDHPRRRAIPRYTTPAGSCSTDSVRWIERNIQGR